MLQLRISRDIFCGSSSFQVVLSLQHRETWVVIFKIMTVHLFIFTEDIETGGISKKLWYLNRPIIKV